MNSTVKTVVFWLVIVLSAFLLWQVVKMGSGNQKEKEVNFSQFMSDVDSSNVKDVTSVGDSIQGRFKTTVTYPLEQSPAPTANTPASPPADRSKARTSTQFKTQPDNSADRLPLLQKELQGEVVFDLQAGRPTSIQLNIDKTIENHQGKVLLQREVRVLVARDGQIASAELSQGENVEADAFVLALPWQAAPASGLLVGAEAVPYLVLSRSCCLS